MEKHHRPFEEGLRELNGKLVHMAALVETMIDKSVAQLVRRDPNLGREIPDQEQALNAAQIEVDDIALTLLATQQPVARDLRFIMAAVRINTDLERIGDLVVNITDSTRVLLAQPPLKPLIDIPRMADLTRAMLRQSLEAFLGADPDLAQKVILADDDVDALKEQVLRELLTYMMADPRTIERGLALILVARHLERIADHATNIGQNVIYMCQGRDVRHPRAPREPAPGA